MRRELAEKSRVVGDTRNWLKMQEDMQRAEHDKIMILKELEEKSREFMRYFSFLLFISFFYYCDLTVDVGRKKKNEN